MTKKLPVDLIFFDASNASAQRFTISLTSISFYYETVCKLYLFFVFAGYKKPGFKYC
ncbi:hypothetical protein SPTER_25950 [Sporomusa termitida]|uniref:Uncharacterized protein n=1 Tax=Sporomusa termitida TaxID=2377 RepID=A0A517DV50_9FIRM|nr:hypothetical protein SPTER_25950 [Sporomusa termitida]